MGTAFQIQDDILNLVGEESKYGKEIGGDIMEGKRTLMLIYLMSHCNKKELALIRDFLAIPIAERSLETAAALFEMMKKYDSLNYARNIAKFMAGAALKEFYTIFSRLPDTRDKAFIESIILYMINRDY